MEEKQSLSVHQDFASAEPPLLGSFPWKSLSLSLSLSLRGRGRVEILNCFQLKPTSDRL